MKRSIISIVAGVATATTLTTVAQADDSSWDGLYTGVHAEYLWGDPSIGGTTLIASDEFDGFAGGIIGGYNHVFDQFLVGVEADVALSDADGSAEPIPGSEGLTVDLDWLATIRARAGLVHENLLVFVTGGVAIGGLEANYFGFGPFGTALDETAVGYTIGGGAELALTDRVTVKVEYLYIDLANENLDITISGFQSVGLETSVVRVGANWRF
ncbi:MAG: outer membrane protein [Methylococcales bacterium]